LRKGLRDLRAKHFAEAAAQAVNSRFDSALAHLQSDGHLLVRQAVGSNQKALQILEKTRFAGVQILLPQSRNHSVERRQRQLRFKLSFGSKRLRIEQASALL